MLLHTHAHTNSTHTVHALSVPDRSSPIFVPKMAVPLFFGPWLHVLHILLLLLHSFPRSANISVFFICQAAYNSLHV